MIADGLPQRPGSEPGAPLAYEFCRDVREAFDGVGCSQVLVSPSTTTTTKSSAFFILACSGRLLSRIGTLVKRTSPSAGTACPYGFAKLQALGIKLVAADSPSSFLDDTPTSKLIRQILGAVSEFDKAMVVAKLKGARERKRVITGKKVESRKSHAEQNPELVALVRQLRRRRPKGGQRSLREISAELAMRGFMNERGNAFSAASISTML